MGIYQKVLTGKFATPKHMDVKARDLIKRFLAIDRTKRIGCLANGTADIKDHKFFRHQWSWQALAMKQMTSPYVPPVRAAEDTSMFEEYPDSDEISDPIDAEDQELFDQW